MTHFTDDDLRDALEGGMGIVEAAEVLDMTLAEAKHKAGRMGIEITTGAEDGGGDPWVTKKALAKMHGLSASTIARYYTTKRPVAKRRIERRPAQNPQHPRQEHEWRLGGLVEAEVQRAAKIKKQREAVGRVDGLEAELTAERKRIAELEARIAADGRAAAACIEEAKAEARGVNARSRELEAQLERANARVAEAKAEAEQLRAELEAAPVATSITGGQAIPRALGALEVVRIMLGADTLEAAALEHVAALLER